MRIYLLWLLKFKERFVWTGSWNGVNSVALSSVEMLETHTDRFIMDLSMNNYTGNWVKFKDLYVR